MLEPPDLVHKHPLHLASSVMVWFVYGTCTLGRGGSIPSNHLEPLHGRGNMVCRVLSKEFGVCRALVRGC